MIRFTPHMLLAGAALAAATPAAASVFDIPLNVRTSFHFTGTGTIDTAYTHPYVRDVFFVDAAGKEITVDIHFDLINSYEVFGPGHDYISVDFFDVSALLTRVDTGATWATGYARETLYFFDEHAPPGPLLLSGVEVRDYNDWWGLSMEIWADGGDFIAMTNPLILDQPGGYPDPDAGLGVARGTWAVNYASVTPFGGETRQYAGPNLELVQPPVTPGIPEPASWALLIAGFGLVGASFRRQRRADPAAA